MSTELILYPEKIESNPTSNLPKISYEDLSKIGVAIPALASVGKSGLYKVTIPPYNSLGVFKDGSGLMGTTFDAGGKISGQARLTPVAFDPVPLFFSISLMIIDSKLNEISKTQTQILNYLKLKDKADIIGSINFIFDITKNLKLNWNNEQYKTACYVKVLDTKQFALQKIYFFTELLSKASFEGFTNASFTKNTTSKLEYLQEYKISLFLYSYSCFTEYYLNSTTFSEELLKRSIESLESKSIEYRETYSLLYDKLQISLDNRTMQRIAEKVGSISLGDRKLINKDSEFSSEVLKSLTTFKDPEVKPFIDGLKMSERLNTEKNTILFDDKNIYIAA